MSVAERLRTAMGEQGLDITSLASRANVDRSFLSRLLGGGPPPRSREGRETCDDRYRRLGSSLGLGEDFLRDVGAEQSAHVGHEAHDPQVERLLQLTASAIWSQTHEDLPLRVRSEALKFLGEVFRTGARLPDPSAKSGGPPWAREVTMVEEDGGNAVRCREYDPGLVRLAGPAGGGLTALGMAWATWCDHVADLAATATGHDGAPFDLATLRAHMSTAAYFYKLAASLQP